MKGRSNFWGDQYVVSKKQIELVLNITEYRRIHNISISEMAKICTLYGGSYGVKFTSSDICNYENLKSAPRKPKFQVLCNVLNMDPTFD